MRASDRGLYEAPTLILIMLDQYSQPEELLADGSFLDWYFKTGDGDPSAWEQWIRADPAHHELVRQAVALLELSRLPEKPIPAGQVDRAAGRLLAEMDRLASGGADRAAKRSLLLPLNGAWRWMAAACFLGLMVTAFFVYRAVHDRASEIRTEFGQLSERVLPDGTDVTMNANSRLTFAPIWTKGADREVWLSGEAFFQVSHTPEKSRFIVHLDHCDVIVTGTRFNVVNRPGKENVMLEEGSVTLRAAGGKLINMRPGDFVNLDKEQPVKAAARPDSLMAWKKRMVFLDNTPLRELVDIVYDQYGVRLHLAGDSTETKSISAILPNNNLEVLLRALEYTGQYEVTRQEGGTITITARPAQK